MSEIPVTDQSKAGNSIPGQPKNFWNRRQRPGSWFLIGGAVFPLAVVIFELSSRACASIFFDPMPTWWHAALVALVPCANFLVWLAFRRPLGRLTAYLGALNGAAIVIALYYALLFAPMLPFILVALLYVLGIIPLSPLFSLVAALRGPHWLAKLTDLPKRSPVRMTLAGMTVAVVALVALDVPTGLTRILMKDAVSPDPQTRLTAVTWLRTIGERDLMLRLCYGRVGTALDALSMHGPRGRLDSISATEAREIYYRVMGTPYNSVPRPRIAAGGFFLSGWRSSDQDLGGAVVGGRVTGLELTSSRLDASVDGDAALGYLEWTLQFKNTTNRQQEARAQLALPPGGVVSRVTLWINGEEREAAFAGRGKVRAAYEKVVRRNRDPLLVTSAGPDRVLVQCFPVPPNGGEMRIRIGITTPLIIPDTKRALLRLPFVTERNFHVDDSVRHLVWIEAKSRLATQKKGLAVEEAAGGVFAVRGELSDRDLWGPNSVIEAARATEATRAWADDPTSRDGHIVLQTIEETHPTPPDTVVLVVDGSAGMASYAAEIAEALASLPEGVRLSVVIAADGPEELGDSATVGSRDAYDRLVELLNAFGYRGGRDNVPALARAWDIAARSPNGIVAWVHDSVPVVMENPDILRQRWDRRPGGPMLYDVQVKPGPNRVLSDLDRAANVRAIARLGTLKEDLARFFSNLRPGAPIIEARRERLGPDHALETKEIKKTSDHLARLWALGEISRLAAPGKPDAVQEAVRLASTYHLVTPVSGAVVLETLKDFKEEGLTPAGSAEEADKVKVPTVPEPETWMLMGILAAAFLWAVRRRRLAWATH